MKDGTIYHIGVDSTDSATLGMCTTYLGAVLLERLSELPLEPVSPPELIRLNPNVPWKTRGNGAVCLRYIGPDDLMDEILFILENTIWNMSVFEDPQTNPGCIIIKGDVPQSFRTIYHRALHEILDLEEVKGVGHSANAVMKGWKNELGLIGALAAVGADLSEHTYEAILYRPGGVKDRDRKVDANSLLEASMKYPSTFFNLDGSGEPICIPHSPCPVILGIRGVDPSDCQKALKMVKAEGYERWVLWKTNQHTDAHIEMVGNIKELRPFSSISTEVVVSSTPEYKIGGHLFFDVKDDAGNTVTCAAYEPTRDFRKRLSRLISGDRIRVWGSVRSEDIPSVTVNLEKIEVKAIAELFTFFNPRCNECGGPTGSMGKGQGLRCKKCGYRGEEMIPIREKVERDIALGLMEPLPDAWRHLYRPIYLPEVEQGPFNGPYWGIGHP